MSQEYTVTEVSAPREWAGNYGPMVSYDLALAGVDERVELAQKPTTPPPTVSQVLFGHIEANAHGPRFKKDQRPDAAPRQNFSGGGKKQDAPWPRQPTPPEDAAAMRRCHSQEMAIETLALAAALGVAEKVAPGVTDVQGLVKTIKTLADSYDADVEAAVASASLSVDDAARRSEDGF